ncbi:hypothetical protein [Desulfosporosinus metallidurans]|uniref:Uncharacterized protein n=1 Tax=Desulfosporosinus metallidurans TaxID=1888891 RepID=A0A1Q8QNN6_9FIRM|nr:hypothetical protein [Desulfosporosinus metallidurans]OLN28955.1 hypothetical protein DSOL_3766 [Desulfosporosinus metallidurans]
MSKKRKDEKIAVVIDGTAKIRQGRTEYGAGIGDRKGMDCSISGDKWRGITKETFTWDYNRSPHTLI